MTNKLKIPYFRVTFYGEYYSENGMARSTKAYKETFNVSEEKANACESFYLYCVTKALPKVFTILKKDTYQDYRGLRTHYLESFTPINGAKVKGVGNDFSMKSRQEMEEFIRVVGVPLFGKSVKDIKNDSDLRELLSVYMEDKLRFESVLKDIFDKQAELDELFLLNSEEVLDGIEENISDNQTEEPNKTSDTNKGKKEGNKKKIKAQQTNFELDDSLDEDTIL